MRIEIEGLRMSFAAYDDETILTVGDVSRRVNKNGKEDQGLDRLSILVKYEREIRSMLEMAKKIEEEDMKEFLNEIKSLADKLR